MRKIFIIFIFITISLYSESFWNNNDYEKYTYETFSKIDKVNQKIDMQNIDYPLLNAAIFYETCRQRVLNSLPVFIHSPALEKAAFEHSRDMVTYNFFSHNSPVEGKYSMNERLSLVGIKNAYEAENIAYTFGIEYRAGTSIIPKGNGVFYYGDNKIENHTYQGLAKAFLESWMNSSGHRANILNPNYKYLGCGVMHYQNKSFYDMDNFKATQNFANIKGPELNKDKESKKNKIILYGRKECEHCKAMKKNLDKEGMAYKFFDIDEKNAYKNEMWEKLLKEFPALDSVTFPVVDVDGKLFINPSFENLLAYIKQNT